MGSFPETYIDSKCLYKENMGGTVVRELSSHLCDPGSTPGPASYVD